MHQKVSRECARRGVRIQIASAPHHKSSTAHDTHSVQGTPTFVSSSRSLSEHSKHCIRGLFTSPVSPIQSNPNPSIRHSPTSSFTTGFRRRMNTRRDLEKYTKWSQGWSPQQARHHTRTRQTHPSGRASARSAQGRQTTGESSNDSER